MRVEEEKYDFIWSVTRDNMRHPALLPLPHGFVLEFTSSYQHHFLSPSRHFHF